jgi:threonine/homoserine/homoserine lactone efflux protein
MLPTLFTIWLLYLGAMISPGPNVLLVSQLAASSGRRAAWFAGIGVASGAAAWATLAVLGVNAVFAMFPSLRIALQLIGAAYLLYLATRLWRQGGTSTTGDTHALSAPSAFRLGALTNITNPKAAMFFGSVFAAAFPAAPAIELQISAVLVVFFSAVAWYTLLAHALSRPAVASGYARLAQPLNRAASLCLGVIGLGLFVSTAREVRGRLSQAA